MDDLNITSIINKLSSEIGLRTNFSKPLTVKQPGLRVVNDEAGKRDYEFSVG